MTQCPLTAGLPCALCPGLKPWLRAAHVIAKPTASNANIAHGNDALLDSREVFPMDGPDPLWGADNDVATSWDSCGCNLMAALRRERVDPRPPPQLRMYGD